ncbi:MAG: VTT domain-containing protein [Verrucomicrobia bacterium]|nr:VTT domain-containing protein [Verrucomicrobiota bacterium]
MHAPSRQSVRTALFVAFVVALVCLPFAIFGEEFVLPLLQTRAQQAGALTVLSILLLAADSVAPVPATLVIMYLAAKAGWLAGIIGGTLGMSAGVLAAAWLGRFAVGRLAPKFFPDTELARLRESLQSRLTLTLACLRSVPVLAETSIIVAAAMGIPTTRIFWVTVLPNLIVSTIYSVAADDSFVTAALTFFLTLAVSYAVWRWAPRRRG